MSASSEQKSHTEVGAGGEEGGVRGEGWFVCWHLCYPRIQSLDVKSYLGYFAPSNHGALRFRDGIWVMNTERRSIVPPFICVEELPASVLRWDRNVPGEADTLGTRAGAPSCRPSSRANACSLSLIYHSCLMD